MFCTFSINLLELNISFLFSTLSKIHAGTLLIRQRLLHLGELGKYRLPWQFLDWIMEVCLAHFWLFSSVQHVRGGPLMKGEAAWYWEVRDGAKLLNSSAAWRGPRHPGSEAASDGQWGWATKQCCCTLLKASLLRPPFLHSTRTNHGSWSCRVTVGFELTFKNLLLLCQWIPSSPCRLVLRGRGDLHVVRGICCLFQGLLVSLAIGTP